MAGNEHTFIHDWVITIGGVECYLKVLHKLCQERWFTHWFKGNYHKFKELVDSGSLSMVTLKVKHFKTTSLDEES